MFKIYCITDCNDLKYVGLTTNTLHYRLRKHKTQKKNKTCSSYKLNLNDCKITLLEETNDRSRERYWINKIDCVNTYKLLSTTEEWRKNYNRSEAHKISKKKYIEKNIDKIKQNNKNYKQQIRAYQKSWGDTIDKRRPHHNLLCIDPTLFN